MISCVLQVVQQISGINAVMYYSAQMFNRAEVKFLAIQYGVCIIGLVNFFMTIISV